MFIGNLNQRQQCALLHYADAVMRSDNKIDPAERVAMDVLRNQSLPGVQPEAVPLDQLSDLFTDRVSRISFLLELIGMGYSNNDFEERQSRLVSQVAEAMDLVNDGTFTSAEDWVRQQVALMKKAKNLFEPKNRENKFKKAIKTISDGIESLNTNAEAQSRLLVYQKISQFFSEKLKIEKDYCLPALIEICKEDIKQVMSEARKPIQLKNGDKLSEDKKIIEAKNIIEKILLSIKIKFEKNKGRKPDQEWSCRITIFIDSEEGPSKVEISYDISHDSVLEQVREKYIRSQEDFVNLDIYPN